ELQAVGLAQRGQHLPVRRIGRVVDLLEVAAQVALGLCIDIRIRLEMIRAAAPKSARPAHQLSVPLGRLCPALATAWISTLKKLPSDLFGRAARKEALDGAAPSRDPLGNADQGKTGDLMSRKMLGALGLGAALAMAGLGAQAQTPMTK